jgi:hypothetical protein
MLALPIVMLFFMGPDARTSGHQVDDFSKFTTAIGAEIAIVDRDGIVREGVLTDVSADSLTMSFSGVPKTFSRDVVASGERLKDGSRDGFVKGAIFGAIAGALFMQGYDSYDGRRGNMAAGWLSGVAVYGGIGWLIDAAQNHREPIYKAVPVVTTSPTAGVKLTLRF